MIPIGRTDQFLFYFITGLLTSVSLSAQVSITGRVTGSKGDPVPYANISIVGTYEGTVTDDSGHFELQTGRKENIRIGASAIGFETEFKEADPMAGNQVINFRLKDAYAVLSPAVITAGTFAAGEQGKAELLRPRDIGTTAGTPGDIQATIEALPGTQRVGYSEGLFVRGGSDKESKYIMDGLIYPHPYYSHAPSLKQHGRLDPYLFSGTVFSAGGYSAQYGQALSSVLILNSKGIADSTITGGGIHTYGGNLFHTQRWKKVSLHVNGSYNNLALYHSLVNANTDWTKSPVNKGIRMVLRVETGKNELLKIFADISNTRMGMRLHQAEANNMSEFTITNGNAVFNTTYTKYFRDNKSSLSAAAAVSYDKDKINDGAISMWQSDFLGQGKIVYRQSHSQNFKWFTGAEWIQMQLKGKSDTLHSEINEPLISLFAESEATALQKLAFRLGIRSEYSHYSGSINVVPRSSLAWKFSRSSQVSFSYGIFYQLPDPLTMLYSPKGMPSEKASHYIANYQMQIGERTLRTEVYYKQYHSLVTEYLPQQSLTGHVGYARGFEVFYRDRKSIPGLDAWISYSLTDSRRRTLLQEYEVTPGYVSKHTLSVVAKYWFAKAGLYLSGSYYYASPRQYAFSTDGLTYTLLPVPDWSSMDISISKPAKLFKQPVMLFFSLQNLWGTEKLLGYEKIPSFAEPLHIYPSEKRSVFFGIFFSMYNE